MVRSTAVSCHGGCRLSDKIAEYTMIVQRHKQAAYKAKQRILNLVQLQAPEPTAPLEQTVYTLRPASR